MMVEELIQQAIAAGKGGDRAGAVRLLSGAVREEPGNARAWYLLSQVIEGEDRARYCLERVLEIDPGNEQAGRRLAELGELEALADAEEKKGEPTTIKRKWLPWIVPGVLFMLICLVGVVVGGNILLNKAVMDVNQTIVDAILEEPETTYSSGLGESESFKQEPTITTVATPVKLIVAPTNTPVALKDIDLSTVLVKTGDLPAGAQPAQIRAQPPKMFDGITVAENQLFVQFAYAGKTSGGVSVFLYSSKDDIDSAFNFILDGMGDMIHAESSVGEASYYLTSRGLFAGSLDIKTTEILFVRCQSLVHVRFAFTDDEDAIIAYAQRLDNRLRLLVCPH